MFLWLRAKTVSHEIRDFPRPAKESAFQMQNITECEIGSILPDENYLKLAVHAGFKDLFTVVGTASSAKDSHLVTSGEQLLHNLFDRKIMGSRIKSAKTCNSGRK